MKRVALFFALLSVWACSSSGGTSVAAPNLDDPTNGYQVIERGPFHRIWQRTLVATNPLSAGIDTKVQQYTELSSGMHYKTPTGWAESVDTIEITETGARATKGPMAGTFNSDITSTGAITLTTQAGDIVQLHPIGLFYSDPISKSVVQIAAVRQAQGTLFGPNVLVFSNILSGLEGRAIFFL